MIAKCRSLIDDRLSVRWTLSLKDCERWFILSSVYLIVSSELEYLSDLLHCKPSLGFFPVFSYSRSLFISERTAHLNEYLCDVTVVWRCFARLSSRFDIAEQRTKRPRRFFVWLRHLAQTSQISLGKFLKGRALPLNPRIEWVPWLMLNTSILLKEWLVWLFPEYPLLRRLFH